MAKGERTSPPRRAFPAIALLAITTSLALGCGGDCDEPLKICDIGSAGCQEHVFVQTACARNHPGRTPPPVLTITRDELEEILTGDGLTELEALRDAQIATALRMLDLLPPGATSNEEAAIASYARNVVAFYSRSEGSVTIVSTNLGDSAAEDEVFVLSHELVHAQQDVDIGLQDFFDANVRSDDSLTATRSVTEGEAVLYSNVTMARQPGASLTAADFAAYYQAQQQGLRDLASDRNGSAYTDIVSAFPYAFGGQLVTDRWLAEGDLGVLELYDDPPPSTGAVLRTLDGQTPHPIELPALEASTLPEGWELVAEDTLGAWVVFAWGRRLGFAESVATDIADGWLGDRLVIVGGPTEPEVALAWTIRFATEAPVGYLAGIGDDPPPEGAREVTADGREITIVAAVDPDALAMWVASFQAATLEPSPALRAAAPSAPPLRPPWWIDPRAPR